MWKMLHFAITTGQTFKLNETHDTCTSHMTHTRHVYYIINTSTILKALPLDQDNCYNNLNKWPEIKAQRHHIHTVIYTRTHSLCPTISYTFTRFGKQEAVVLGNQRLLPKARLHVWPPINPTSNTPSLLQWDCIGPANNQHPQAANTHTHSIRLLVISACLHKQLSPPDSESHVNKDYI